MSNVVLAIGGREYSMTCAVGEEAHIGELGRVIDEKLRSLPDRTTLNDSRSLLFAALLLADELHELRKSAGAQTMPTPNLPTSAGALAMGDASPERLAAVAERLEALVDVLEIAA